MKTPLDKKLKEDLALVGWGINDEVADKIEKDVREAIREFRNKILNPNTISKNFIEISEFNYWINKLFGKLVEDTEIKDNDITGERQENFCN